MFSVLFVINTSELTDTYVCLLTVELILIKDKLKSYGMHSCTEIAYTERRITISNLIPLEYLERPSN